MSLSVDIQHQLDGFHLKANFTAPSGVTALFGASGSGKTSVINAVAGLIQPDQGDIALNGVDFLSTRKGLNLPPHKRGVGYVFQDSRLFPHMSVLRNLRFGGRMQGKAPNAALEGKIFDMLALGSLLDRMPVDLSGGEKQRTAIGRALLAEPTLLMMDEPLAALDERRKQEILPYLERLRDEAGLPILYVSHSVSEVARLANHLVVMQDGQVVQSGAATDVLSDLNSAQHIGADSLGAVITAQVQAHDRDGMTVLHTEGGPLYLPNLPADIGSQHRLRIKAQDVMLSLSEPVGISALNCLKGVISDIQTHPAGGVLVQITCADSRILSRITQRSLAALSLQKGQQIFAVVKSVSLVQGDIGLRET